MRTNLAVVKVDSAGRVAFAMTSSGYSALVADVAGYYLGAPAPVPATQVLDVDPPTPSGEVRPEYSLNWSWAHQSYLDCHYDTGSLARVTPGTHACGTTADSCAASLTSPQYRGYLLCVPYGFSNQLWVRSVRNVGWTSPATDPWPLRMETTDGSRWFLRSGGSWSGRPDSNPVYGCDSGPCRAGLMVFDGSPIFDKSTSQWRVRFGVPGNESPPPLAWIGVSKVWYLRNSSGG